MIRKTLTTLVVSASLLLGIGGAAQAAGTSVQRVQAPVAVVAEATPPAPAVDDHTLQRLQAELSASVGDQVAENGFKCSSIKNKKIRALCEGLSAVGGGIGKVVEKAKQGWDAFKGWVEGLWKKLPGWIRWLIGSSWVEIAWQLYCAIVGCRVAR